MLEIFSLDEQIHHRGDARCPGCAEDYPVPCSCGGLVHATTTDVTTADDPDVVSATRCDRCGRSEGDLQEVA
jgi:hypothetical protein